MRPGETLSSTQFERRAGGKGANQAVAIAQAGAHVTLIGAIGIDGDWLLRDLASLGVDTTKVVFTTKVGGIASLLLCVNSCAIQCRSFSGANWSGYHTANPRRRE